MTPELPNYINQQRSAGVPDAQIRQNLVNQGWSSADLDQAFGITSVNQSQISEKNNTTKIVIIIVAALIILPLLFWGAIAGYGYYKYKKNKGNPDIIVDRGNIIGPLDCNASQFGTELGRLSPVLPKTWPSDIPVYSGSKLMGSTSLTTGGDTSTFAQVVYCSKDDVEKITNYFLDSRSGWIFTKSLSETGSNTQVNAKVEYLIGKKTGPGGVTIVISNKGDGGNTLITEIYSGSVSNQPAASVVPGYKIYNKSSGFTVQIPSEWQTIKEDLSPVLFPLIESVIFQAPAEQNFIANMTIEQIVVDDSVSPRTEAAAEKKRQEKDYPQYKVISEETVIIDGLISYRRIYSAHSNKYDLDVTTMQIWVKKENNLLVITGTSLTSLYSKYGPIFQTIVDSFKVI